jgi:uncharacterized protein (TIGR02466 family)|tara:strand:+ start:149 stop:850 length:702 start_codon:yes stop_codon:yes gene_type:complete
MSVEKEKSLFHLFPLALFRDKIDITEPERKILINEILSQEKNSKNTIDKGAQPAWTGDTQGYEFLFKNKKFEKLFSLISASIKKYTNILGLNNDKFNFYYQRSWATISRNNENIYAHKHHQSHITFAYYLKKSKEDGNINFHNESLQNEIAPQIFNARSVEGFFKTNLLNAQLATFTPEEDEILIFPSKTMHSTSFNKTSEERISIAADVTLVAKDSMNSENLLPPIDQWDKF